MNSPEGPRRPKSGPFSSLFEQFQKLRVSEKNRKLFRKAVEERLSPLHAILGTPKTLGGLDALKEQEEKLFLAFKNARIQNLITEEQARNYIAIRTISGDLASARAHRDTGILNYDVTITPDLEKRLQSLQHQEKTPEEIGKIADSFLSEVFDARDEISRLLASAHEDLKRLLVDIPGSPLLTEFTSFAHAVEEISKKLAEYEKQRLERG